MTEWQKARVTRTRTWPGRGRKRHKEQKGEAAGSADSGTRPPGPACAPTNERVSLDLSSVGDPMRKTGVIMTHATALL